MDSCSSEHPAGFQLGRRLGTDVWEAVQPGLERAVALRRLPPGTRVDASAWPERPGVVPLFAVAEDPSGVYVATRLLPGARTLAELRSAPGARRRRWLDQAAEALDGAVHGRLGEHEILVDSDGRAWVTGFGRAPAEATAADDRQVLARLRPAIPRRRWVALATAVAVAAATIVAVVATRTGDDDRAAPAPPVTAGAQALGSALAAGESVTVDCEGATPGGASPACTVMQATLPGRPLVAARAGLVRGWAVRGFRGRVALQVVVPAGDGFVVYNRGPSVSVDDRGAPRVIAADMSFPKGARFAIEVAPGAAIGIRRTVPDAGTVRFLGPLRSAARPARAAGGEGEELLLRVDVVPRG
jgi:hypothetical protein